jgi:hypothetical protein
MKITSTLTATLRAATTNACQAQSTSIRPTVALQAEQCTALRAVIEDRARYGIPQRPGDEATLRQCGSLARAREWRDDMRPQPNAGQGIGGVLGILGNPLGAYSQHIGRTTPSTVIAPPMIMGPQYCTYGYGSISRQ